MKKRFIMMILAALPLIGLMPLNAFAGTDMYILRQPQNPVYNIGAVAGYSVTVAGENLTCTWYLHYDGVDYDITNLKADEYQPWEMYVTEGTTWPKEENNLAFDVPHTTFYYYFIGIEEGLAGSYIYAVISNGEYTVQSDIACIQLLEGAKTPPTIVAPVGVETTKGEKVELVCSATSVYGGELTYVWYETHDGDLSNARPMEGGHVQGSKLICDTDSYGVRYYVCYIREEGGGYGYSNVIPVTVMEGQPTHPTVLTPLQVYYYDSEGRKVELLKSTDSQREVIVDLTALKDSVSGGLVHVATYTDPLMPQEGLVTFTSSNTAIHERFTYRKDGANLADEVLILFTKTGTTTITAKLEDGTMQTVKITVVESSELEETFRIIFEANGATGTMEDVILEGTNKYTLPACEFTAPEGKMFDGWSFDGEVWWPGEGIGLQGTPTTITALWADLPIDHICDVRKVEKVEPTETEPGKEAYYICSGCGNPYEDEEAGKLIEDLENWGIIAPLGGDSAEDPTDPTENETKPVQNDSNTANNDENAGVPWWIVLLSTVCVASVITFVTLLVSNKKKGKQKQ